MLFIVNINYQKDLNEVDSNLNAHRNFLLQHYMQGHFLASGPKLPRTGGIILSSADSKQQLERWLMDDPFIKNGVATYEIVAWQPTLIAECLSSIIESMGASHPQLDVQFHSGAVA